MTSEICIHHSKPGRRSPAYDSPPLFLPIPQPQELVPVRVAVEHQKEQDGGEETLKHPPLAAENQRRALLPMYVARSWEVNSMSLLVVPIPYVQTVHLCGQSCRPLVRPVPGIGSICYHIGHEVTLQHPRLESHLKLVSATYRLLGTDRLVNR